MYKKYSKLSVPSIIIENKINIKSNSTKNSYEPQGEVVDEMMRNKDTGLPTGLKTPPTTKRVEKQLTPKDRYKIPEGKQLGTMLKLIEEEWVRNNFEISEKQIDNIVKG